MKLSTALKAVSGISSILVAIGADSDLLPDCKLKHIMVSAGIAGAVLTSLYSKLPKFRPDPLTAHPPGPVPISALQAGDVLLYGASGIYDLIIERKTWHRLVHVEVFIGNGESVASRNGVGTGRYPVRLADLAMVCRPVVPFDLAAGLKWFEAQPHRPYGWWELLQFLGYDVESDGVVCSPYATDFERGCHLDPFNGEPSRLIVPFEFILVNCYAPLIVDQYGALVPHTPLEVAVPA